MLTLGRKLDESITIRHKGEDIVLKVVSFQGAQVRLGFDAAQDVKIIRQELLGREV